MKKSFLFFIIIIMGNLFVFGQKALIINHTKARLSVLKSIPISAINKAKDSLHIRYDHTSHGSQITSGMDILDIFMGNNGIYTYEKNQAGKLDLEHREKYDLSAYQSTWVLLTQEYLDDPVNADCNVVMWSWCDIRGHDGASDPGYCSKMESLIAQYGPNGTKIQSGVRTVPVQFIFMTGHVNAVDGGETQTINAYIRNHCITNNRILFDFEDIESWDPGDVSFVGKNLGEDCSYEMTGGGRGNWATEWTTGKILMSGSTDVQHNEPNGGQWYDCVSAHSHALNANIKAYAAWYMFARLAGWKDPATISKEEKQIQNQFRIFPNPAKGKLTVENKIFNDNVKVILTTLNGAIVKEYQLNSGGISQIDISDIPRGLYICSIKSKSSNSVQKLIVQ